MAELAVILGKHAARAANVGNAREMAHICWQLRRRQREEGLDILVNVGELW